MGKIEILSRVDAGKQVKVYEIKGGMKFLRKLQSLGISRGSILTVVKTDGFGPIIVSSMNSNIAIGRGMADKITVEIL